MIVTNNPKVREQVTSVNVMFVDGGYLDVLLKLRDMVHKGHVLLTHPLMGSVKPGETPFRSVIITDKEGKLDVKSLQLIEAAIMTFGKFTEKKLTPRGIEDCMTVDLSLIMSAL